MRQMPSISFSLTLVIGPSMSGAICVCRRTMLTPMRARNRAWRAMSSGELRYTSDPQAQKRTGLPSPSTNDWPSALRWTKPVFARRLLVQRAQVQQRAGPGVVGVGERPRAEFLPLLRPRRSEARRRAEQGEGGSAAAEGKPSLGVMVCVSCRACCCYYTGNDASLERQEPDQAMHSIQGRGSVKLSSGETNGK